MLEGNYVILIIDRMIEVLEDTQSMSRLVIVKETYEWNKLCLDSGINYSWDCGLFCVACTGLM